MKGVAPFIGIFFLVFMTVRMWAGVVIDVPSQETMQEIVMAVRLSDCALLHSIDVFSKKAEGYTQLKHELKEALNAFRTSKYINELSFQRVINMIKLELDLVHHLIRGDNSNSLVHVLDVRNHALAQCTPSELYIYDKILDLGTYDSKLEQMSVVTAYSKNRLEKDLFLRKLLDTLSYYHASLRNMLYEVSINAHHGHSRQGGHAIIVNTIQNGEPSSVMFCPVEL